MSGPSLHVEPGAQAFERVSRQARRDRLCEQARVERVGFVVGLATGETWARAATAAGTGVGAARVVCAVTVPRAASMEVIAVRVVTLAVMVVPTVVRVAGSAVVVRPARQTSAAAGVTVRWASAPKGAGNGRSALSA